MVDVGIALALGLLTLLTAYLGIHVTLYPAESHEAKTRYKIAFVLCAVFVCVLSGVQAYRNDKAQNALATSIMHIESNTASPPKITFNVPAQPPPQVIVQPAPAGPTLPQILAALKNEEKSPSASKVAVKSTKELVNQVKIFCDRALQIEAAYKSDSRVVDPVTHQRNFERAGLEEDKAWALLRGQGVILRDEMLSRIPEASQPKLQPYSTPEITLNQGSLAGPYPLADTVVYLQQLSSLLPPDPQ